MERKLESRSQKNSDVGKEEGYLYRNWIVKKEGKKDNTRTPTQRM